MKESTCSVVTDVCTESSERICVRVSAILRQYRWINAAAALHSVLSPSDGIDAHELYSVVVALPLLLLELES